MSETYTNRPRLFIEKIMPIKLLNEQVYFENGGNPFKGLHRWYSRKPLSFSRASVLASVLPADISMDEFQYLLGVYSEQELGYLQQSNWLEDKEEKITSSVRLYKTPPSPRCIGRVHDYCEKVWGKRTPVVLDAFAGGGSIPFEAARYGFEVYGSDLNPVAVVTMKAAMEYPLKFGPDLQVDIDKWVQWVGNEAETRLAAFFPSPEGETVQNYLWAHTVQCPSCNSTVPLSPNWWLSKTSNYAGKGQTRKVTSDWYAVKPIPKPAEKRVDFELIKGRKGKGSTIHTEDGDFDPNDYNTISRSVGKCPNCGNVIEDDIIKSQAQKEGLGHQLYAVAYKKGKGSLEFRTPAEIDLNGITEAELYLQIKSDYFHVNDFLPDVEVTHGQETERLFSIGIEKWSQFFNPRQLLTLVTYAEIINEAKEKIRAECELEKAAKIESVENDGEAVAEIEDYYRGKLEAIATYLALVMDRCVDRNCRLGRWHPSRVIFEAGSAQHALNLMWNYPEVNSSKILWQDSQKDVANVYEKLCEMLGIPPHSTGIPGIEKYDPKTIKIDLCSADSLWHIGDKSVDVIVTDPPYYGTIQYAELSDFFYVWLKITLGDIFPDLFYVELTDKDREAVANPSRFRNMGISPDELANQDYEAKMALAFGEYHRVLRDDGIMTVQFNHKDSGAWDVLAKSLIDAGFEITASWAVSTENPQNLHQAKKNSVSSTVLLVCRQRDPNAGQAWWEDLRPEVVNLVEKRAPEFEANDITGIDLYLSAFGPALNVFSRQYPILNSSGEEVRPEEAFAEARKAIANYRFRSLVGSETAGFDALSQWYLLAWDAFRAREFPYDDARQLALAIGGFNVTDLVKTHKLLDSASGTCKLLTPQQRLKKRAFSVQEKEFSGRYLVDGLHGAIAIYQEEQNLQQVRRFLQNTGLVTNDLFMKIWEVGLKVIPDTVPEREALVNLRLGVKEIKDKVVHEQLTLDLKLDP
ncbi:hypothetical protein NIES46_04420 [Arthrospira platensis NIES-46]|uniref:DUF1156 domain-containing protein n=1 Tax=Limnospira platensis NIES-46 TaxID=1236695 RepID=A0A5M3T1K4_LIMPL|nr:DUF1156 domain-containing protein [Arthrospira platensis]GCE92402.1 hypothetical protein NIES46_04420 [Arthrospira platensis NIES-46]